MVDYPNKLNTQTIIFLFHTNLAISLSIFIAFVIAILADSHFTKTQRPNQGRGIRLSEFPGRSIQSDFSK